MKLRAVIALFFVAFAFILGKKEIYENHEFKNQNLHVVYQTRQGRMNGLYSSYYPNGVIKAKGFLENGFHKGTWIVQDSLGQLLVKREYSGPFNYKSIFPVVPRDPTVDLFDKPCYTPKRNDDGFFDLIYLEENSIVASKRIWRSINHLNNEILFNQNFLYGVIDQAIKDSVVTAYDPLTDEFWGVLETMPHVDANEVVSFMIKEDWVFDDKRNLAENRIIGICPQVLDPSTGKPRNLYWIYYPQLRQQMAKIKINWKGSEGEVKTLDDLFFFRCFHSRIVKEANVYDRSVADYTSPENRNKESDRIELSLLELEHLCWYHQTFW